MRDRLYKLQNYIYFFTLKVTLRYSYHILSCPNGFSFDSFRGRCVVVGDWRWFVRGIRI